MELAHSVSIASKTIASKTLDLSLVLIAFAVPLVVGFAIDQVLVITLGPAYENLPRAGFFYVAWPVLAVILGLLMHLRGSVILSRGMFLNALFVGLVLLSYLAISTIWTLTFSGWLPA